MKFIKSKLFIGIVCFLVAILVGFVGVPMVNKMTNETVSVVRFKEDIKKGTVITQQSIEVVKTPPAGLPENAISTPTEVIDKFAVTDLQKEDFATTAKVSASAPDYLHQLPKGKMAVSFTVNTFAAGLSGKVLQDDIISLFTVVGDIQNLTKTEEVTAENHPALTYLKVLSATAATGIDTDNKTKDEDGNLLLPATITVLANAEQAKLIAGLEQNGTIQVAVVSRGNTEYAEELLSVQQNYFDQLSLQEKQEPELKVVPQPTDTLPTEAEKDLTPEGGKANE